MATKKKLLQVGGEAHWIALLGGSGSEYLRGVAVDSSGNIIAVGQTDSDGAGSIDGLIAKYNSSGTLQWSRTLGGTSGDIFYGVAVDSSDNIIAVGSTNSDGAGSIDGLIAKYNSSGTLQWDKTLGGANSDIFEGVAVDSSDNIIAVGSTASDGAGGNDGLVAKYNSSGTLQWDRTLGGTSGDVFYGVAVDSSDNIISAGVRSNGAACSVTKYDSSGTLQWDRYINGSSTEFFYGVAIDFPDIIIAAGYTASDGAGSQDGLVTRLSPDGSGEGVYGAFTYAASSAAIVDAAAVLTNAAAVLTDAAAVLTDAVAVLTDDEVVLTEELFPLP